MAELFKEQQLYRVVDGKFVEASASELEGKKVALYFSAHWCGPCRGFTPSLKQYYEKINAETKKNWKSFS